MKYALIDIGGGMRDAFGTGVTDYLLDENISIKCCIGVSAGASNLANYISGQRGRGLRFYDTYPNRKEYMGFWQLIRHGSFLNMKYIYEDISFPGKEDPFDIASYTASDQDLTLVATEALSGKPVCCRKHRLLSRRNGPRKKEAASVSTRKTVPFPVGSIPETGSVPLPRERHRARLPAAVFDSAPHGCSGLDASSVQDASPDSRQRDNPPFVFVSRNVPYPEEQKMLSREPL